MSFTRVRMGSGIVLLGALLLGTLLLGLLLLGLTPHPRDFVKAIRRGRSPSR